MIDYETIKRTIVSHVRTRTGHPVILQASNDTQPAYPFCTYTVTSPYLPVTFAEVGDDTVEDVEMVFSLTWHSQSATEVQGLAHQTAMLFKMRAHRQQLGDAGIAVVRLEGMQNRDTFLTIDNERRVGFDVRFRVRHTESAVIDSIATVEIPNLQGG
jgi:hypothetical protein